MLLLLVCVRELLDKKNASMLLLRTTSGVFPLPHAVGRVAT